MPQIINDNNSIGALFGSGLGSGLGAGLQQLAQHKIQNALTKHQAKNNAKGLANALNIPERRAFEILMQTPEIQNLLIKNHYRDEQSQGLNGAIESLFGEGQQQQSPQENPQQQLQQQLQQQQEAPGQEQENSQLQNLLSLVGGPALQPPSFLPKGQKQQDLLAQRAQTKQLQQPAQELVKSNTPVATHAAQKKPDQKSELRNLLSDPRLTPEQRLKIASLQQQKNIHQEKLSAKEQEEVSKETKPAYDEIAKHAKAAKDNTVRLKLMQDLIDNGDLDSPGFAALVETTGKGLFGHGFDVSALLTPDSQEFRKLSKDFVKSAKDYFGSRLTDTDLKVFLETVPTLLQSNEGKVRVINNLRLFNDIAIVRKKAAAEVIKENGGRRPRDFEERVEEKVDPIANQYVEEIRNQKKSMAKLNAKLAGTEKPSNLQKLSRLISFSS